MKANPRVDVAVLVLRVGLGLILMYYGSQKLFGIFGGMGPKGTIDAFQKGMGIPMPFTILAMIAEFFGGLGMVVGLLTPLAAFGVACAMSVATYENCRQPGLLDALLHGSPPVGVDPSKPFYTATLVLGAFCVMLIGAGRFSLDAKLFKKSGGRR